MNESITLAKNNREKYLKDPKRIILLEVKQCLYKEFEKENIDVLKHDSNRIVKECIENTLLNKADVFLNSAPVGMKYQLRLTLENHKINIEITECSHPHSSSSLMIYTPSYFYINTPIGGYNISCSISSGIEIDTYFIKKFIYELLEYSHKLVVNKSWKLYKSELYTTSKNSKKSSINFLKNIIEPLLYAHAEQDLEKITSICDRVKTSNFSWTFPENIVYPFVLYIFSFFNIRVPEKTGRDSDYPPLVINSDEIIINIRSFMEKRGVIPPKKEETAFFDEMQKMFDRYYSSLGIEKPLQEKEPVSLEELTTPTEPLLEFTEPNRLRRPDGYFETGIEFVTRVYGDHMRALVFTSGDLKKIDAFLYEKIRREAKELEKDVGEVMLAIPERNAKLLEKFEATGKKINSLPKKEADTIKNIKHHLKNGYKRPVYSFLDTIKAA